MNQTYYLPANLFYYYITWEIYYQDFTWDEFDNTWNT